MSYLMIIIVLGISLSNYRYKNMISIADISLMILFCISTYYIFQYKIKYRLFIALWIFIYINLLIGLFGITQDIENLNDFLGSFVKLIYLAICSNTIIVALKNKRFRKYMILSVKVALAIHIGLIIVQVIMHHFFGMTILYNIPIFENTGNINQLFAEEQFRATGLATEPAHTAGLLAIYAWIVYVLDKDISNKYLAIISIGILLGKSMSGLIILGICLMMFRWETMKKRKLISALIILLLVTVVAIIGREYINTLIVDRIKDFLQGDDGSISARILGSSEALISALRSSFGVGIGMGNLEDYLNSNRGSFRYLNRLEVYNILFYTGISAGILGMISYLYIIFENYSKRMPQGRKLAYFIIIYSFTTGVMLVPLFMILLSLNTIYKDCIV